MKRLLILSLAFAAPAFAASSFLEEVQAHFSDWDVNDNGELSVAEIEKAVAAPQFQGPSAAAIASLRRAVRTKEFKLPALTLSHIRTLVPKPKGRADAPDFESMFASALKKIESSSAELMGPGDMKLECLEQGKLGDCFCLAPLGAVLERRREDVVRMFAPTNDGRVSVTFGGGRVLRVPFPTDAERALMAASDDSGAWVNCYEKAVGLLKMDKDNPEHHTELSVVTRGCSAGTMMSILTGHEIVRASCLPFREKKTSAAEKKKLLDDIRRQMTEAQAAGRLVCGGTFSGKTADGQRPPGVRGPHAYAILNYDTKTDGVTLWDPHGDDFQPKAAPPSLQNGYPRTQGRVNVPLTELVQWFGGFSFETDRPLKDQAG